MRLALLCLAITFGLVQNCSAAVVFSITSSNTSLTIGQSATITVRVLSNSGNIANLGGIDFGINVNDPGETGTVTSGGRITDGNQASLFVNNPPNVSSTFLITAPAGSFGSYAASFTNKPTSFVFYSGSSTAGLTLTGTATPVATFTLSTVGATLGSYQIGLSQIAANDPLFNDLGFVNAAPLNFTISAVPEPSSILLTLGVVGIGAYRMRRTKMASRMR